jgi:hypothetical protein
VIAVLIAAFMLCCATLAFVVLLHDDAIEPLDLGPLNDHQAMRAAMDRHPSNPKDQP